MVFKNVICEVCCAIVLCYGIGFEVISEVEGMEKVCHPLIERGDRPSFVSIAVDFPYFLNSRSSAESAKWPSMLANVSQDISCLLLDQYCEDRRMAYSAIFRISYSSFDDFMRFCGSKDCDIRSKLTIVELFKLIVVILKERHQTATTKTAEDLQKLIRDTQSESLPVSDNSVLFENIADIFEEL